LSQADAQYAGNYSGTFDGDSSGVWSFTISASGNLTGRAVDSFGEVAAGTGTVSGVGSFALVMADGGSYTFSGVIDGAGHVTGIWEDALWLGTGTVSGSRLPTAVAQYAGTYSGTLSGDASGTWSASVDSAGNWTGSGTVPGLGTFGVNGIVSGTGAVTTYIEEGGILTGQINPGGQISGTWTDYEASGNFTGNRTSTELSSLENWRQTHFGSPADSGDGANSNDYDKDGITNLLEFAFGLHPKQNSAGLLPKPERVGGNLVFTFIQPDAISGITYGAEWSPTMAPGTWQALPDIGTPPQHSFSTPIDGSTKKFVRLSVLVP
jgi:hypothetical protein